LGGPTEQDCKSVATFTGHVVRRALAKGSTSERRRPVLASRNTCGDDGVLGFGTSASFSSSWRPRPQVALL